MTMFPCRHDGMMVYAMAGARVCLLLTGFLSSGTMNGGLDFPSLSPWTPLLWGKRGSYSENIFEGSFEATLTTPS